MLEIAAKSITSQYECKIKYLQVRSPVCCGEPPPDPTGWCLRPRLYDARCRRVAGQPISGGRRYIQTTARPLDQGRRGLLLLVVIGGDPDESTTLWRLTALRQQRFRRGGVCCERLFPATLSSVVRAGWFCSSSLLGYRAHRAASPSDGSTPAGFSMPGASDTNTAHRSTSPIYSKHKRQINN